MSSLLCFLWWILLGALLGWLASWLLGRRRQPDVVERLVEKPVDRVVETFVDKPVDNPLHLARISALESETALIPSLRDEIARLRATPPVTIEKIVEKPVDRVVEKIVEKPVDRVVEKVVEKMIDNPAHLSRIKLLEGDAALVSGLRREIAELKAAPPKTVEKIVEKPVDRVVEKIVDRPVDRVVEKLVPDTKGIEEREARLRDLQSRHDGLESELARLRRGPDLDIAAARAAGFTVKGADDFEIVEGIGPKIADLLRKDGIVTFAQLAGTSPAKIRGILDRGGSNFKIADPGTWPEQADLAARNRWAQLKALQDELVAGVRVARTESTSEVRDLKAQLLLRDAELKRLKEPAVIDVAAARAAGFNLKGADDLEIIEGIGPKIAELLHANGVKTFAQLSNMTPAEIQPILDKAGPSFRMAKPDTWPEQADLAARNHWRALLLLQQSLTGGVR